MPALTKKGSVRVSNFLTLVLRDDPAAIGLRLNHEGWANVNVLIKQAHRHDIALNREALMDIKGFEFDQTGEHIRVCRLK